MLPPKQYPFRWIETIGITGLYAGLPLFSSLFYGIHSLNLPIVFSDYFVVKTLAIEAVIASTVCCVLYRLNYSFGESLRPFMWRDIYETLLLLTAVFSVLYVISIIGIFDHIAPINALQVKASVPMIIVFSWGNALFEEFFLLGYLLRHVTRIGWAIAIGVSLLVRVLCHLYQGPIGMVNIACFGFLLSLSYIKTGRIWPAVWVHTGYDIVALNQSTHFL